MDVSARAAPFRVEVVAKPGDGKRWGTAIVNIYDGDKYIGKYERFHPQFGEQTFEPFELNGSWYALYSGDYTSTRVMSLPDCTDLGGEDPASRGFCPVELYVPRYRNVTILNRGNGKTTEDWWFEDRGEQPRTPGIDQFGFEFTVGPWVSLPTGFVAGCIWGDDSTWKLEVFDLSRAAEGIITRSARFGHCELAPGMSLAQALRFDRHLPDWELRATVIRRERRDVATGKLIDPYDE